MRNLWIAAYDIRTPRQLSKTSRLLFTKMTRIQKSVFAGHMNEKAAKKLYTETVRNLSDGDRFIMYPINKTDADRIISISRASLPDLSEAYFDLI